ncbi:MAG: hypothetical protein ACP5LX_03575 [Nitrososphaeria archaeon]
MNEYTKLFVPFLILISAFSMPAVSWASSPLIIYYNWGTPQSPITVRPGYTNQPFIVILQPDAEYRYGLLNLTGTPFTNVSGGSLAYSLPSQSSIFTFYLNVKASASAGKYPVNFTVYFLNGSSSSSSLYISISSPPNVSVLEAYWGQGNVFPTPSSGVQYLNIVIGNPDKYPVSYVKLTANLPNGISAVSGSNKVSAYVPYIAQGSFQTVQVPVNVTNDIKPGTYSLTYNISFEDYEGVKYSTNGSFNITVYSQGKVSVLALSAIAPQNSIAKIFIKIFNDGTIPVTQVQVEPIQTQLQLIGNNYSQVQYLLPGKSLTFTYNYSTQNVPQGTYPLAFQVSYVTTNGQLYEQSYVSYVSVTAPLQYVSLSVFPTEVYYMRNNTLSLVLSNSCNDSSLRNVQLYVQPVSNLYIYNYSGIINVGNLNTGSQKTVTMYILPEINVPAVIPLQVEVSYLNPYGFYQEQTYILPIFITGKIQISFESLNINSTAYNGSTVSISGSLLNSGTQEAYYGTIEAYLPSFSENVTSYIGDLPVDSPTPFALSLYIPQNAQSGSYTIYLRYVYQDSYGKIYSYQANLPITVYVTHVAPAKPSAYRFTGTFTLLLVIIAVLLLVLIIFCARKKK